MLLVALLCPMVINAQEYRFKVDGSHNLIGYYPDYDKVGGYKLPERCDIAKDGEEFHIYAYDKKEDRVYVYNQHKMGIIVGICDELHKGEKLSKILKDTGVYKVKMEISHLIEMQNNIRVRIDKYYAHEADLWRIEFVKDSIEQRKKFVADSIAKRQKFVQDSIEERKNFIRDSIKLNKLKIISSSEGKEIYYDDYLGFDSCQSIQMGYDEITKTLYIDSISWKQYVEDGEFIDVLDVMDGVNIGDLEKTVVDKIEPDKNKKYINKSTLNHLDADKDLFCEMQNVIILYVGDSIYTFIEEVPTEKQRRADLEEMMAEFELKREIEKEQSAFTAYIKYVKQHAPILLKVGNIAFAPDEPLQLEVSIINFSTRKIKYVDITGQILDRVNEPLRELRTRGSYWKCRVTGPITPAPRSMENYHDFYDIIESGNLLSYMMKKNDYEYKYGHIFSCQTPYYFASLDYDMSYHTKITSATITYMDGSKISLTGKQLEKAQSN